GDADDGCLVYPGRSGQSVLDLDAVHVLAAAVDHVFGPVDDVDEAIGVDAGQVSGVQPAAGEGRRGGVGLVPVPGDDVRPADEQLADVPGARCLNPHIAHGHREPHGIRVLGGVLVRQVGG